MRTCNALYRLVVTFSDPSWRWRSEVRTLLHETVSLVEQKSRLLIPESDLARPIMEHLSARLQAVADATNSGRDSGSDLPRKTKRGLINVVGKLASSLFGVATEQDVNDLQNIVTSNRNSLSVISHKHNVMAIVVNTTRMQMLENSRLIDELVNVTSDLHNWMSKANLGQLVAHKLLFRVALLESLVSQLELSRDKMTNMRKDLEQGILSEDLLPPGTFQDLITSARIPKDSRFITPLIWYYSNLHVQAMKVDEELVYSMELPLVSGEETVAKEVSSYPAPNVLSNVSLQVDVPRRVLFKIHDDQAIELPTNCIGSNPIVCPPLPINRESGTTDRSCIAALLGITGRNATSVCPVKVTLGRKDEVFYHDVNTFILVTWGTDITEGCFHSRTMQLNAGTYLVKWSGECPLCTQQHCISGIVRTGSTLRLEHKWQSLQIPKLDNFSVLNLPMVPARKTAAFKLDTLEDLFVPDKLIPAEQRGDQSSVYIVILCISCVCILFLVSIVVYVRRTGIRKFSEVARPVERVVDAESAIPLQAPIKAESPHRGKELTLEQAAAVLLANPVEYQDGRIPS